MGVPRQGCPPGNSEPSQAAPMGVLEQTGKSKISNARRSEPKVVFGAVPTQNLNFDLEDNKPR